MGTTSTTTRRLLLALLASVTLAAGSIGPAAADVGPAPRGPSTDAIGTTDTIDLDGDVVLLDEHGEPLAAGSTVAGRPLGGPDDHDHAVDEASGTHGGADELPLPQAGGLQGPSLEGFRPFFDVASFTGPLQLRLESHPDIETIRPHAAAVASELSTITGVSFSVAAGTVAAGDPTTGQIRIRVSASSPCPGDLVIGCATPWVNTTTGQIVAGEVWILPLAFTLSSARLRSLVRHEVGHTLGLDHYQPVFDGSQQVMASGLGDAVPYGTGDRNGLRFQGPLCASGFADVASGHLFCDHIGWARRNGVLTGFPGGAFQPGSVVTRQAVAALLWRYAGEPTPSSIPPFSDVGADHPFREAIAWMVGAGITTGFDDNTFRPGSPITRQALATFLYRYLLWRDPSTTDHPATVGFSDVPGDSPFRHAISVLATYGVVQGSDGRFRPADPVTRQAVAAFTFRFDSL